MGGTLITAFDDPNADEESRAFGINDEGDIVGSYRDSKGNMDGFLAFPAF